MENELIPDVLYYTTINFDNGEAETPHFFVFNSIPEGIVAVREYYKDLHKEIVGITMKEMVFVETILLPEETHILVPVNDFGIDDEFRDTDVEYQTIQEIEDSSQEALVAVLPEKQEADFLMCDAYYMGPMKVATTGEEYVHALIDDPFESSQPIDYVWLYRPTGESRTVER